MTETNNSTLAIVPPIRRSRSMAFDINSGYRDETAMNMIVYSLESNIMSPAEAVEILTRPVSVRTEIIDRAAILVELFKNLAQRTGNDCEEQFLQSRCYNDSDDEDAPQISSFETHHYKRARTMV
jgi:hypothetical protein